jgi:hypothetical protein
MGSTLSRICRATVEASLTIGSRSSRRDDLPAGAAIARLLALSFDRSVRDGSDWFSIRAEGDMRHHLIGASLLVAAVVLETSGVALGGALLIGAGVACEIWFWMRLVLGRSFSRAAR